MRALLAAVALFAAAPALAQAPATSATLADAAKAPTGRVIVDGATWRCEGDACTATGGSNQPATRACRRVVAKLGPVTPVIEDAAFAAAALELLPETIDADAWSAWTSAVKDKTGAKGKGLFMPLRLILTGQAHGPDMAAMIPLIGRERMIQRLKGETA